MLTKKTKKTNWRLFFLTLFGVNLFCLVILFILIFSPTPNERPMPEQQYLQEAPGAEFTIESTKKDLNELINNYIGQVLKADNAELFVHIDDDVHLFGTFTAFNTGIPISLRMEPIVLANGDIVLRQTEMSLGLLNLPKNRIIHYVDQQVETPDWVYFDSESEAIYLAISQIDIQSNFNVSVEQLDLANDDISFRIKIPSLDDTE